MTVPNHKSMCRRHTRKKVIATVSRSERACKRTDAAQRRFFAKRRSGKASERRCFFEKRRRERCEVRDDVVPLTGIEPVRCCHRGILSPLRLPIPPCRHDAINQIRVYTWMEVDSNHRSNLQQIYSLSPLATRESIHFYHHQLSWL